MIVLSFPASVGDLYNAAAISYISQTCWQECSAALIKMFRFATPSKSGHAVVGSKPSPCWAVGLQTEYRLTKPSILANYVTMPI